MRHPIYKYVHMYQPIQPIVMYSREIVKRTVDYFLKIILYDFNSDQFEKKIKYLMNNVYDSIIF